MTGTKILGEPVVYPVYKSNKTIREQYLYDTEHEVYVTDSLICCYLTVEDNSTDRELYLSFYYRPPLSNTKSLFEEAGETWKAPSSFTPMVFNVLNGEIIKHLDTGVIAVTVNSLNNNGETIGCQSGSALLLRGQCEIVEILAAEAPDVGDVVGGGAHVVVVERIPQTVADHGVGHLAVEHALTPAGAGQSIGGVGHIFSTAADHDLGVVGADGAGSLDHALHAGAADHVDGVCGNGDGQTGLDAHLTGNVLAQRSGDAAAEHQLIDLLGLDACTVQSFFDDDRAHVSGVNALQASAEGADGGTAAIDNIDIFHWCFPPDFA